MASLIVLNTYEYDLSFRFLQRYVLTSGHTDKGIQM
jgi:hypothetical protein